MPLLDRITRNPEVMGGKACIRAMRVTVGTVVGLVAAGHSNADILNAYPYLEEEDIWQALSYATCRVEEIEILLFPRHEALDGYESQSPVGSVS